MLYVNNQNEHDPALNLALEEFVLRNAPAGTDLVLFYINAPSIIIGRHQNTLEEINLDYVEKNNIHVVRRLSGGGAVYHDLGNLNFSFITDYQRDNFSNFKKFTEPVVRALAQLGVTAELSGRNDLVVDGRKVSGNAQHISRGRMVSHGTVLLDSNLDHVSEALHVQEGKFTSKAVKSVRSRVANICEFLDRPISIEDFREHLLNTYFEGEAHRPEYPLSEQDWAAVRQLAQERYRTWAWNFGRSPDFNVQKKERFPGGEIDARLSVQQGVIRSITFYGDFFSEIEPAELEPLLVGTAYRREDIAGALKDVPIGRYFSGMDLETFVRFLY